MATHQPSACTLITGANSGIGLEFARLAAADGSELILVARNADSLAAAAAEISQLATVHVIPCDLSEPGAAAHVFAQVQALGATVDCLINDAGFGDYGGFATADLARQERMISVNITALTALTRLVLPGMIERAHGRILNVASVTGFLPGPLVSVYFATKHYVLAFSESLAEELRGTGVTVTALCPPPVRTSFAQAARISPASYMATTKVTAPSVASYGYRMMNRGKPVAVYTIRYKLLTSVLIRATPRFALRRLLHRMNAQGAEQTPAAELKDQTPAPG